MQRRKKILISVGIAIVTFLILTGLVMPAVIKSQALDWVAENTDRVLKIDELSFNPLNGKMTVEKLSLSEADSEEIFLAFERLVFDVNISSVWTRSLIVDRLQLFSPAVNIVKYDSDAFNFSDLVPGQPETTGSETEPAAEPFQFAINNFIVHDGSLDYQDRERPDVTHAVREFDLALPFIGNTPALADEFVQPRLSLKVDDAPFVIEGEAKPFADSLEASLQIRLEDIDLPFYAAYLPKQRPVDIVSGKLAVDLDLSYEVTQSAETRLLLGGELVLTSVAVQDQLDKKVFFLPLAQVKIAWADLLSQRAVVDELAVYGLEVFVDRNAAGQWNHARLAKNAAGESTPGTDSTETAPSPADQPHVQLHQFRLRNGVVHFRDEAGKKPFVRQLRDVDIDIRDLDNLSDRTSPFKIRANVTEPTSASIGSIAVNGEFGIKPVRLQADMNVAELQLAGIESYFPPEFAGVLSSGHLDSELKADFTATPDTRFNLAGKVGLRALRLTEPVQRSDVLSWESLQLDGIDLQIADGPAVLQISELALNSYLAKILVTAEGEVNLQKMLAEPEKTAAEQGQAAAAEPAGEGAAAADAAPVVVVDRVTLQGGTLEFIDQHMPKPFNTRFLNLGGRISGIDSRSDAPAQVDLRGNLENRSPLKISGGIRPLGEALYADLKIRFDSIEMSPMTPYSGNYLGYAIEKGKLYLDLDYKIDGSRLQAANHVFLDQFTFGQRIDSDDATSLPVRLAVALLKDGSGEIHLDLPVSGSLDDPQFSVIGVVFTILKNLLVKAATSPFKLLAAVLGGGGGDDFSTISFPHGVATLQGPEETKLARLSDALQQRPALKLEISGYVDRENDPEAWRRTRLENALREQKYKDLKRSGKLAEGATPGSLELTAEERPRYLEEVYKKADFPKPRNALGFVKSIPPEEMEKLILANTPAGEEEMQALADARARVVYENLTRVHQLPVERVFLKQDEIYRPPDEEGASGSRVDFGATVD